MIEAILVAAVVVVAFCYSQMRYHEGVIDGLRKGEMVCRKYHGCPPSPGKGE